MAVTKMVRALVLIAGVTSVTGCATYYNHYGRFTAENSSGETRDYLVRWQTAEYPDWWLASDRSTPVSLETQCSERVLTFVDNSNEDWNSRCATADNSVVWCGDSRRDRLSDATPQKAEALLCGWISTTPATHGILGLGTDLEINIRCEPMQPTIGEGKEQRNFDYLKASPVPYAVAVKRVEKGSEWDYMVRPDEKACKAD